MIINKYLNFWFRYGRFTAFLLTCICTTIILVSTLCFENEYWDTRWHWLLAWTIAWTNFTLMNPRQFFKK